MPPAADVIRAPAPWRLTGTGTILLCCLPRAIAVPGCNAPPFASPGPRSRFGAAMMVDYHTSPVGPYREALFIPGAFHHARGRFHSITAIFVSTMASVVNGRRNWGIPKQQADFDIRTGPGGTRRFVMYRNGGRALEIWTRARGPQIPFDTRWLPLTATLVQQRGDGLLLATRPSGKGLLRLAQLKHLQVDPDLFPEFSGMRLLGTVHATRFELCFPIPNIWRAVGTSAARDLAR